MDFRLPIPRNWQDFESICHQLWKEIWNDPNAEKNGRQGQAQNGIDIFGTPIYSEKIHGVQCKDKDSALGSKLEESELLKECGNAKGFIPKIESFTLATTAPRDGVLQKKARELTENNKFPFSVQVWSWDDIQTEIAYRPLILNNYYPGVIMPIEEQLKINLNRYSPKEQFQAYFLRPSVKNLITKQLKDALITLAYEFSDNAYKYGNTTNFSIIVDEKRIVFKDNGIAFNPLTELSADKASAESNIGSYVFDNFIKKYSGVIVPSYTRISENGKEFNILQFDIIGDIAPLEKRDFIEIYVNLNDAAGRYSARKQAESVEITSEINEVILTITYNVAMSFSIEFIRIILKRLNEKQKLILSVPRDNMFNDIENWFKDDRLIVKYR